MTAADRRSLPPELRFDRDDLVRLPGAELARYQLARLAAALTRAAVESPYWAQALAGRSARAGETWTAERWAREVPAISKSDLLRLQKDAPPYGGLAMCDADEILRLYVSYGPIVYPYTRDDLDFFSEGFSKVFTWAGVGRGDVVDQTVQYNWVAGGTVVDDAFRKLGCAVIPGGVGQREKHIEVLRALPVSVLFAFPTFVRQLLEAADELHLDPARDLRIRHIFFTGETIEASAKSEFERRFGASAREFYGTTESGIVASECEIGGGMHLFGHHLVEVVDPHSGETLDPREGGEIVLTSVLPRRAMPLFRFRTGDVTEGISAGACSCGRLTPKLGRIVGRTGTVARVKGMFLFPARIGDALAEVGGAARYQVVVTRPASHDVVTVRCELTGGPDVVERATRAIHASTGLSVCIEVLDPGSIPTEAPVLEDRRDHAAAR